MTKHPLTGRHQVAMITVDDLVPSDHLVRQIDQAISFAFIYPIVEPTYSSLGRPSIDPVVLVKFVLLQYLFGIRSMRQTIKEVDTNMAYRWFLGFDFTEKVPHFSTFGKNYARRFRETTLFEDLFSHILEQAVKAGFITEDNLYMDSTHVKANANKHRFNKELTRTEAKSYQKELEKEINDQRIQAGKKPFTWDGEEEVKEKKISRTDPESGYYVKSEREKQFAYAAHTVCEDHGFVLECKVTPGNIHDSQVATSLLDKVRRTFPKAKVVAADAGYKTPAIAHYLVEKQLRPVLPYTRPRGKKAFFRKKDFVYDEYYDCYLCPADQILTFSTITREGYREYKSSPEVCKQCPLLAQCTQSQSCQKVITRHVWQEDLDIAEELRFTKTNKTIYQRRKETIERVFADAKEKHSLRWTKYRSLEKVTVHTMLTFAAMNLKKLATWIAKGTTPLFFFCLFSSKKDKSAVSSLKLRRFNQFVYSLKRLSLLRRFFKYLILNISLKINKLNKLQKEITECFSYL